MKKVYIVYDEDGMQVFTTMKDAIAYATNGQDVFDSQWEGDNEIISMTSIRRDLKNWVQISAYTHIARDGVRRHFTITPTVLYKRNEINGACTNN